MKKLTAVLFFVLLSSAARCQSVSGNELFAWVRGIEGKTHEGRRSYIEQELQKLGVRYSVIPFAVSGKMHTVHGSNIVVALGKGSAHVVVGAHYDAVPGSPGANDNGGGVAVILGLIKSLRHQDWNHRIAFCFFDQEEAGLLGSAEFVRTYKDSSHHLAMINLDVEGTGEEVYVGPVGGGDDDFIMPLVRSASAKYGYDLHASPHYPPSDQLSFAERRLENISISIVPRGDSELLSKAEAAGWQHIDPKAMPEVLRVMHTPHDSSTFVSPAALNTSWTMVSTILHLINTQARR